MPGLTLFFSTIHFKILNPFAVLFCFGLPYAQTIFRKRGYMHWIKWFLGFALSATLGLGAVGLDDAKGYNKNSSLQWEWAVNALEKYPWTGSERVLDLGCGDGKITAFISKECSQGLVVGYDISPNMITFASSLFRKDTFTNLLFQEGDIAILPFRDQFDLAVAFCSLHYVVEQQKALAAIHKSLGPKGKLLFVGPGRDSTSVANISETLIKSEKWAAHFPHFSKQRVYYTKDEYIARLQEAGFEPICFDVTHDRVTFANKQALISWLRPIVNYISHLSESLQQDFLADIATIMMQSAIAHDGETVQLESTLFECLCERV